MGAPEGLETVASAVASAAAAAGRAPVLLDPMCGSGTFLIEGCGRDRGSHLSPVLLTVSNALEWFISAVWPTQGAHGWADRPGAPADPLAVLELAGPLQDDLGNVRSCRSSPSTPTHRLAFLPTERRSRQIVSHPPISRAAAWRKRRRRRAPQRHGRLSQTSPSAERISTPEHSGSRSRRRPPRACASTSNSRGATCGSGRRRQGRRGRRTSSRTRRGVCACRRGPVKSNSSPLASGVAPRPTPVHVDNNRRRRAESPFRRVRVPPRRALRTTLPKTSSKRGSSSAASCASSAVRESSRAAGTRPPLCSTLGRSCVHVWSSRLDLLDLLHVLRRTAGGADAFILTGNPDPAGKLFLRVRATARILCQKSPTAA